MLSKTKYETSEDLLRRSKLIHDVFKEGATPYLQVQQDGKIVLVQELTQKIIFNKNQIHHYDLLKNECMFLSREIRQDNYLEYNLSSDILRKNGHEYLIRVNLGDFNLGYIFKDYDFFASKISDIFHIKNIIKNVFSTQEKHQYIFMDLYYSYDLNANLKKAIKFSCYAESEFQLKLTNIYEPLKDKAFMNVFIDKINNFIDADFSGDIYKDGGLMYVSDIIESIKY